ncbi:MAG: hypothetical protein ACRC5C_13005 [Bacilli bacterium]
MRKTILIIGQGVLGKSLIDLLLTSDLEHDFIISGRNTEKIQQRTNLAEFVGINMGRSKRVKTTYINLDHIEETAETLSKLKPDIIFNATTLMSYWVPSTLPNSVFERLYYAFTGWQVPMHLTLIYKLMQSVRMSGIQTRVINASYPDVTNAALHAIDLGPEIGIGNLANVVPVIKKAISVVMELPIERLDVRCVGHHHFSYMLPTKGSDVGLPYDIEVRFDNGLITNEVPLVDVFACLNTSLKRTRGLEGMAMTAASAFNVIRAMANEDGQLIHAPGVNGLPGGYPVQILKNETKVVLPTHLSLADAIDLNVQGQVLDGVKSIGQDGTIVYSEREMTIVKEIFGYACIQMHVTECEAWAQELAQKYEAYAKRAKQYA